MPLLRLCNFNLAFARGLGVALGFALGAALAFTLLDLQAQRFVRLARRATLRERAGSRAGGALGFVRCTGALAATATSGRLSSANM